jgi:phage-related protein
MSVFTYLPATANVVKKPRVLEAKFGDGYAQRTNFGVNANPQIWQLTFDFGGNSTAHQGFLNFLDALNGTTAFDWTPPGAGASLRFVCKDYACNISGGYRSQCTATFEQDFGN